MFMQEKYEKLTRESSPEFPFSFDEEGFVCDGSGKRVTFYHGTTRSATDFNSRPIRELGIHVGTKEQANEILLKRRSTSSGGQVIFPIWVKSEKHVVMNDLNGWDHGVSSLSLTSKQRQERESICKQLGLSIDGCRDLIGDSKVGMREFLKKLSVDTVFYQNNFEDTSNRDWSAISVSPGNLFSLITGESLWTKEGAPFVGLQSLGTSVLD
jgi:hypothetical protein